MKYLKESHANHSIKTWKVNYPPLTIILASLFTEWVSSYNSNELDVSSKPTDEAMNIAKQTNAVVCSALPRSLESTKLLKN